MSIRASALLGFFMAIAGPYVWETLLFPPGKVKVTKTLNETYDFIIVGSGTAGSVIAARLSANPDVSVLLLEAGAHYDENEASHVPSLFWKLMHTDLDWNYYTEPQINACLGLNNQQSYWPRGKVLGGSNILNMLQYTRGSKFDFDLWQELGCEGWSYDDVLPFFIKSEDILVPELKDSPYHGKGGPMGVSDGRLLDLDDLYLKAAKENGYNIVDYNGEDQEGFSSYQFSIRNGVRVSTAKSYLELASHRPNLHIAVKSMVTQVNLKDKQATGVYVVRDNKKVFIGAKKEVILAAGALNSPQLLMLSGIGPKEHIEEIGIPVVADLPVGHNLQDHPRIFLSATIDKAMSTVPSEVGSVWNQVMYSLFGSGPLGFVQSGATSFLYTDESMRNKTGTDTQLNFFSTIGIDNFENVKENLHEELRRHESKYGFITTIIMNHLKSTGTVTLRSADPFDYPIMDPRYLTAPSDVEDCIKAIRLWEKFIDTPTIRNLGISIDHLKVSACKDFEFRSDAYWECYVRHFTLTTFHHCCTCKMGAKEDPKSVVDPKLRVKGIKGLRVADASVFPQETSGNLNAPIVMVAEKLADMILNSLHAG